MSRYAMARRQRKQRSRPPANGQKHATKAEPFPATAFRKPEEGTYSQHELIARRPASRSFVSKDIHRLVRVTALNAMILQRSPRRWQHPATQVRHRGDGPGLEIGPQHAPGPLRPIESADRSTAKEWVAPARLLGKRNERIDLQVW